LGTTLAAMGCFCVPLKLNLARICYFFDIFFCFFFFFVFFFFLFFFFCFFFFFFFFCFCFCFVSGVGCCGLP
jgi:hypothetical protein